MFKFFKKPKKHPFWMVFATIGVVTAVGGLINDTFDLFELGLPNMAWAAIGAFIFFVSVLLMVHQLHSRLEAFEKKFTNQHSGPDPTSIAGKIASSDPFVGCVARLQEILTNYNDPIASIDEATERLAMIDLSDSSIWADKNSRQARRDFLNRCTIVVRYLKDEFPSAEEERKSKKEVIETGDKLIEILKKGIWPH